MITWEVFNEKLAFEVDLSVEEKFVCWKKDGSFMRAVSRIIDTMH